MSVPEGARGEGKFSLAMKAEELARYTIQITANKNVFLAEYQSSLTDDIVVQAKNAYLYIREANEIIPDPTSFEYARDRRDRQRLQKEAIKSLKRLVWLIDLAHHTFHLSRQRVKYWGGMAINIRERTYHWMKSDMQRFSDEEQ